MLNLLPQEEKKALRKEYLWRLATVATGLLILVTVIIIALAVPTLFLVFSNHSAAEARLGEAKNLAINDVDKNLLDEFDSFKNSIGVLRPTASTTLPVSNLIKAVIAAKNLNIKVASFSYIGDDYKNTSLIVSGNSAGREDLLSFTKKLGEEKSFSMVDSPVSNFSKKSDIDFTITLKVANP